jgi:hypothetical protein
MSQPDSLSPDWPHDQDFDLTPEVPLEESFARFYELYPRHEAKKDAFKAWTQLRPDGALLDRILANLKTRVWPERTKHIPLPASYLRGYRWNDEPGVDRPTSPANRWQPARESRLIKGGMGIWCDHEPMCETDMAHVRKMQGFNVGEPSSGTD